MATNILRPTNDRNFPYWPGLGIQSAQMIPGQQMAGEIADIPINKDRYSLPYTTSQINTTRFPEVLQDRRGATQLLEARLPMGRGAGIGLTDMLLTSIAQQQAQTKQADS